MAKSRIKNVTNELQGKYKIKNAKSKTEVEVKQENKKQDHEVDNKKYRITINRFENRSDVKTENTESKSFNNNNGNNTNNVRTIEIVKKKQNTVTREIKHAQKHSRPAPHVPSFEDKILRKIENIDKTIIELTELKFLLRKYKYEKDVMKKK